MPSRRRCRVGPDGARCRGWCSWGQQEAGGVARRPGTSIRPFNDEFCGSIHDARRRPPPRGNELARRRARQARGPARPARSADRGAGRGRGRGRPLSGDLLWRPGRDTGGGVKDGRRRPGGHRVPDGPTARPGALVHSAGGMAGSGAPADAIDDPPQRPGCRLRRTWAARTGEDGPRGYCTSLLAVTPPPAAPRGECERCGAPFEPRQRGGIVQRYLQHALPQARGQGAPEVQGGTRRAGAGAARAGGRLAPAHAGGRGGGSASGRAGPRQAGARLHRQPDRDARADPRRRDRCARRACTTGRRTSASSRRWRRCSAPRPGSAPRPCASGRRPGGAAARVDRLSGDGALARQVLAPLVREAKSRRPRSARSPLGRRRPRCRLPRQDGDPLATTRRATRTPPPSGTRPATAGG